MPLLIFYLLKLSISLAVAWLFYRLVLRRLTFYNLNRWYLLGSMLLSFLIPFVHITPTSDKMPFTAAPAIIGAIPTLSAFTPLPKQFVDPLGVGSWDHWDTLLTMLGAVALVLLVRMGIRWLSLGRIRKKAELISENNIRVYQVNSNITPFSFFSDIYVDRRALSESEWKEIILHEWVHIRQVHSIDILLAELLIIVNWYNPFAWLIRYSIRQNLEFIADGAVLDGGLDKKDYQYHLLKTTGNPAFRLANSFNFSSLKKRIIMMNRVRTTRPHLLKLLLLLPLIFVLLVALRDRFPGMKHYYPSGATHVNIAGILIDERTLQPLPGVSIRLERSGQVATTDANGFYKLRVPVTSDTSGLEIHYQKDGYHQLTRRDLLLLTKPSEGRVYANALAPLSENDGGSFLQDPAFESPADPGYPDAKAILAKVITDYQGTTRFNDMQQAHPEISLFYVTTDHQRRYVFYRDGRVERYGGAGHPSFEEMDRKYAPMPWYMTRHRYYGPEKSSWQSYSDRLQNDFRSTDRTVKAIVFPGDGNIIVIPASGLAEQFRLLEFDNDPGRRSVFEARYGKLPYDLP